MVLRIDLCYRLCPLGSILDEECFQRTPLKFAGQSRRAIQYHENNFEPFVRLTVLRSVDLWIKGSVKSRTFLLRRDANSPQPSGASHGLFYPEIPPPQYTQLSKKLSERLVPPCPAVWAAARDQPLTQFFGQLGSFSTSIHFNLTLWLIFSHFGGNFFILLNCHPGSGGAASAAASTPSTRIT